MNNISLCIPTINRFDTFLSRYIPQYIEYLNKNLIDEIVICDENGNDYQKINEKYKNIISDSNGKIRIYKNDKVLGVFMNKNKVCSLAKCNYIALIDSDNFPDEIYFQEAKKFILNNKLSSHVIIAPSFAKPNFSYKKYCGTKITKSCIKNIIHDITFQILLNTGNFIISNDIIKDIKFDENIVHKSASYDVVHFNLLLFQQFNDIELYVIEKMEYQHVIHDDSEYLKTHHIGEPFYNGYILPEWFKI